MFGACLGPSRHSTGAVWSVWPLFVPELSWHTGPVSYQHVIVEYGEPFATITLNRPEKRNALALDVMLEVTEAFREVGSTAARSA